MVRLIEIKGLGDAVANAKKGISDLKAASGKLNESTGKLVAEINDLTSQVEQHRADLRFEAETLGNSNGAPALDESQKPVESPKPLPATQPAATHFNPPAAIYESPRAIPRITLSSDDAAKISPQEVGQAAAVTFSVDPLQARRYDPA